MKQIKTLGWLVMAAALTTTFAACSSDDNVAEEPAAPVKKTVSVTVGAGFNDEATTRSAITEGTNASGAKTRTLTFTEGDKLFVRANYGSSVTNDDGDVLYEHVLRGYLTMASSPSADGKSASFSGDLEQWNRSGNSTDGYQYAKAGSITVTFTDALGDAAKTYATLVHNGTTEGNEGDYTDYRWSISYYYVYNKLATGENAVNTLMTKYLDVSSSSEGNGYNQSTKSFKLNDAGNTPIVNCTINGLTTNTTYNATYVIGESEDDKIALSPTVTADASGTAKFAFFGDESATSHKLRFVNASNNSDIKIANLGDDKNLGQAFKIFTVTRTATAE